MSTADHAALGSTGSSRVLGAARFLALACAVWLAPPAAAEDLPCGRGFRASDGTCKPVEPPPNADLDASGHDWRCRRGYRKADQSCIAIDVPANASLNPQGDDFVCWRGHRREAARCIPFQVPEHADLDASGHDWRCRRGYRRAEQSCIALQVPTNASLDETGNDWKCWPGYRPIDGVCTRIELPRYAELDPTGNAWVCWPGYKRVGDECTRLPAREYAAAIAASARADVGDADDPKSESETAAEPVPREPAAKPAVFEKGGVYLVTGQCGGEGVSGSVEARSGAPDAAGDLESEAAEPLEFLGALAASGRLEGVTPDGRVCSLELTPP